MHPDGESASTGQTLRWHQRVWGIGKGARAARHRFHWHSEDTLALLIVAIAVLVIFMVVLRP
jgi:hypothetical protein